MFRFKLVANYLLSDCAKRYFSRDQRLLRCVHHLPNEWPLTRPLVRHRQIVNSLLSANSRRLESSAVDEDIEDVEDVENVENDVKRQIMSGETKKDFDDYERMKKEKQSLKKHAIRDRRVVITPEVSIMYMKSKAYKQTYSHYLVWELFRRNFRSQWSPINPRRNCVDEGFITTSNPCPICRDKYLVLHYTNLDLVNQFIHPSTGNLIPNQVLCLCYEQYERLCVAYTLAKDYGLITFEIPFRKYDYKLYYPQYYKNNKIELNQKIDDENNET